MNSKSIAALAALAVTASAPSHSALVKLDFEGINDQAQVDQYYNGGTDSPAGSADVPSAGPNYHVYFGPDAIAFDTGSPSGNAMKAVGAAASLFAAPGGSFSGSIAFSYYSLLNLNLEVRGSAGNVLQTLALIASPDGWTDAAYSFNGNAASFYFGSAYVNGESIAAFDNIAVTVPEPGVGLLLLSGLAVVGGASLRRRHAARS